MFFTARGGMCFCLIRSLLHLKASAINTRNKNTLIIMILVLLLETKQYAIYTHIIFLSGGELILKNSPHIFQPPFCYTQLYQKKKKLLQTLPKNMHPNNCLGQTT